VASCDKFKTVVADVAIGDCSEVVIVHDGNQLVADLGVDQQVEVLGFE